MSICVFSSLLAESSKFNGLASTVQLEKQICTLPQSLINYLINMLLNDFAVDLTAI
jgi:hypothetical protein